MRQIYYDCLKYITVPLVIALSLKYAYNEFLCQLPLLVGIAIVGIIYVILSITALSYIFKASASRIIVDKLLNVILRKK